MTDAAERQRRYRERHPDRVREAARQYAAKRRAEPRVLSDQLCGCGCGEHTYLAATDNQSRAQKRGEPLAYRHGHNPARRNGQRIVQRYVEEERGYLTPCWIWQLKINRWGYAVEKNEGAHRRYYRRYVGPIPEGYDVDHLCHVRACVNPEHLQAVTRGENLWRMWMGRAGLTPIQITSLRTWMATHLSRDQIEAVWEPHVVD